MKQNMILPFQGLRAVAFLGIFLFHCSNENLTQLATWSVSFFFFLSGYLSGYLCETDKQIECTVKNSIRYTVQRIRKLYGLHIIMLLAVIPISDALVSLQTDGIAKLPFWGIVFGMNATLTQSLYPKYYFGFNGVSWFLSCYAVLCLVTPFLLRLLSNYFAEKKLSIYLKAIGILSAMVFLYCFVIQASSLHVEFWTYICPLGRTIEYGIGMIAGLCYQKQLHRFPKCFQWIACAFILILSLAVELPEWFFRSVVWIIPNILLLWSFQGGAGILGKTAKTRLFVFLGSQSAYMFLIHQVIWRYFEVYGSEFINYHKALAVGVVYIMTLVISLSFQAVTKKWKCQHTVV